nr:hypothetical protein [Bryobacter sp.]
NTLYTFSHKVKIAPDMFALDLVTLHDEEGHTARIGGTILHNGLKDWNFNVWGEMNDLMVLNTTVNDNTIYNLSNTPQFDVPQRNLSSPSFGRITNTLNDGRVMQVGLRLVL